MVQVNNNLCGKFSNSTLEAIVDLYNNLSVPYNEISYWLFPVVNVVNNKNGWTHGAFFVYF